jgi:glycerophosphoryl diester phosphodiesterase
MFPNWPAFTVFAHRGASAHAPENTLASFALAVQSNADAIEFDVKLSADGHVIVIHDATLDRTTGFSGKVSAAPLKQIKELDAGSFFSGRYRGEKIPTLDEVFEAFGKKIFMNVELTNYSTPFDVLVPKVAELVKRHNLQQWTLFSSFLPHNLMRTAGLLPEVPRGQLSLSGSAGGWQRAWGNLISIQAEHPNTTQVTEKFVASAHKRGRRVHVWTVNDPADMKRLHALGADGFFSDDPLLALQTLGRRA